MAPRKIRGAFKLSQPYACGGNGGGIAANKPAKSACSAALAQPDMPFHAEYRAAKYRPQLALQRSHIEWSGLRALVGDKVSGCNGQWRWH